jgi:1,4-alpha-glucan branching enzyme
MKIIFASATNECVIRVDEYEWKYDSCYLPPDEELVIYEIHVGDFSGGENDANARGTFTNVMKKIDYLKGLGVNASMCRVFPLLST